MSWAYRGKPPRNIWRARLNTVESAGNGERHDAMKIGPSSGKPHPAIVAEASAWFIEFRAGDMNDVARQHFIEWLRRSPEHIQAYLEVSGAWPSFLHRTPKARSISLP